MDKSESTLNPESTENKGLTSGQLNPNPSQSPSGSPTQSRKGSITGSRIGSLAGSLVGSLVGSKTGSAGGLIPGSVTGSKADVGYSEGDGENHSSAKSCKEPVLEVEERDDYNHEPTAYEMSPEAKLLEQELSKELSRIREDLCMTSEEIKQPEVGWEKISMTLPLPHSIDHYRRSRKVHARKLMKVRDATT